MPTEISMFRSSSLLQTFLLFLPLYIKAPNAPTANVLEELGKFPLILGKAVWKSWWKKPHFCYFKRSISDVIWNSKYISPQEYSELYAIVISFKWIFRKQTVHNWSTDLPLTLHTNAFKQKILLVTWVIQVDIIWN